MILVLLATLGVIVTAFVLHPVFAESAATHPAAVDENEVALSDLSDKKAMLYEAIQELEFEKDSGKISSSDYESSRSDYLAQVAAVIEEIDGLAPPEPVADAKAATATTSQLACASCGAVNPKGSKFCLECGKPFGVECASCGESLPAKAKFCNACGEKVKA